MSIVVSKSTTRVVNVATLIIKLHCVPFKGDCVDNDLFGFTWSHHIRACSVSSQSMWIEWDWMCLNHKKSNFFLIFSNLIQSMCIGNNQTMPYVVNKLVYTRCFQQGGFASIGKFITVS
jgi:hypothetical protein